ncbi:putative membrane protein [Halapricum desulfuricans]|uniref:Putative membrane protein n=2 Tax=Halapricum desulfuricans TaxID=2841257 RepID=A0A897NE88_9EURY|nr:putative membrane protein [Halapricum desulfuricans]
MRTMSDERDEEYVHRPEASTGSEREFGWRGWLLVGALVISFLVVPWVLILFSSAREAVAAVGLPWRETFLVVPLIPAVGLGVLGVWAALAARR